eukprot:15475455-Alexandrium_andersonii.AAC.1
MLIATRRARATAATLLSTTRVREDAEPELLGSGKHAPPCPGAVQSAPTPPEPLAAAGGRK